jgi:hypothetical protein
MPKIIYRETPAELKRLNKQAESYFKKQDKDGKPYSVIGLAKALGMHKDTLYAYRDKPFFSDSIKNHLATIEQSYVENLLSAKGSQVGHIFTLKNNYGWRDKQEVEHKHSGDIVIVHDAKLGGGVVL